MEDDQDNRGEGRQDDGDEPYEADYLKAENKRQVAMLSKEVRELKERLLAEVEEIIDR